MTLKGVKVLVTGGAGFIGSNLVDYLFEKGCQVKTLDIKERPKQVAVPEGVTEVIGDISQRDVIREAVRDVELVFHLASLVTQKDASQHDYWKVNVDATRSLLEESKKHGIKKFIYCSSDSVSGRIRELPAKESDPCFPENIYGVTKYEAEKEVLRFQDYMDVVIARPTRVYGPRDMRMLEIFKKIKKGRFFMVGEGDVLFHPVFITDLLEGLELCALKKDISGEIFYLGGKHPIQLKDFLAAIAEYLEVKLPKFSIPIWTAGMGLLFLEGFCSVLRIRPILTRRNLEFFTRDRSYDISKAKRVLGYKPKVHVNEGVKSTGDWYREMGLC